MDRNSLLSSIPKVDELLNNNNIKILEKSVPRAIIVDAVRDGLNNIRQSILKMPNGMLENYHIDMEELINNIITRAVGEFKPHLKNVVNCTGIIIHTNLGRSPLCREAVEAAASVAGGYSNLEYNIDDGERGSRYSHIEYIVKRITGAESAMVVNNNAAAVLLALGTLCKNKEAVVSRGELVEIGGLFRVPEVMEQSGAKLVEVGTTNRTHAFDYENAINENTGVLLKVHTSNYRILGFTESVSGRELSKIGAKHGIPVIEDIGSGSFIDFSRFGLNAEPTVQDAVSSGIDIVTFSGDKMLGGPQAGIIVGKKHYIEMMKKNPLTRALRVDKMTIAALEATLKKYINEEDALKDIPTVSMIIESEEHIKKRARILLNRVKGAVGGGAEVYLTREFSQIGGGAMPLENLPTYAVCVKPKTISAGKLEERLRKGTVPVIGRVKDDSVLLDVRTVKPDQYGIITDAMEEIFQGGRS